MKKSYKISITLSVLLFTLAVWSVGFIMGNSAATLRLNRVNLDRNVAIFNALEKGNIDNAKDNCKAMISGGYLFLNSKPFWLVALREHIYVDSNEYYERAFAKAEELSRNLRPLDEVLNETLD